MTVEDIPLTNAQVMAQFNVYVKSLLYMLMVLVVLVVSLPIPCYEKTGSDHCGMLN